jgi:Peptidase M50B-like
MFTKKTNQTEESKITAKTREYLGQAAKTAALKSLGIEKTEEKEKATKKGLEWLGGTVSSTGRNSNTSNSIEGMNTISTTALRNIVIASVVSIALSFIPYGQVITYPMNLFVTFIHEGCHALMTLLTGGMVRGIGINPDTSGVTNSTGGMGLLVYPAGYIGSTVFGALLIRLMQKGISSNKLLMATAIITGLVTLATLPGFSLFGLVFGAFLTALLVLGAKKLPKGGANIALAIVAVQCILGSLLKLHLVFQASLNPLEHQDPNLMANATLIPAPVWSILWAITSLAALWYVLRPAAWKNRK